MSDKDSAHERHYWRVSQNLYPNNDTSASEWARASVRGRVAFMGWGLSHPMGKKFARKIAPGDVILIGRRHQHAPELVGFGIVQGKYGKRAPKGTGVPKGSNFGSLRKLTSFIDLTRKRLPTAIPFEEAVRSPWAMQKLHPKSDTAHKQICEWMDRQLPMRVPPANTDGETSTDSGEVKSAALANNPQMDYKVHKKSEIIRAKKRETRLVEDYRKWLERRGRKVTALKYKRLQCDAFEERRENLIEAKSSIRREHIRMAVGQILDYAHQIKGKYRNTNMALLLPEKPTQELVNWLRPLKISVIWREKLGKLAFSDNAKGQFA